MNLDFLDLPIDKNGSTIQYKTLIRITSLLLKVCKLNVIKLNEIKDNKKWIVQ